jgi:SAM-dependent methyltransferase
MENTSNTKPHGLGQPSSWVQRWAHLIPQRGSVLDVACGHGRHMQWLQGKGHQVTGVDRAPEALAAASAFGETVLADLENAPWPLMGATQPRLFDAVVVTNYLWRPLFPLIRQSLAKGGVLIYETFAQGNETVGKPSRPDFLLQPGELLRVCDGLRVVAFEEGVLEQPERFVQRTAAIKLGAPCGTDQPPMRYTL